MMYLEKINKENDIKLLNSEAYSTLASEIREFIIDKVSVTGGHLGSNLGVVELTMALHLCLNLPEDKIVWDVGHQAYTHKLLTGRRDGFDELRKYGGMSGFPKRKESDCDAFDTGHSSTSISAALGLAKARDLKGDDNTIVAVIGDGALTGGMAWEALNNASRIRKNFIIILNDNNMSISENVGGLSNYLQDVRTADNYIGFKTNLEKKILKMPKGEDVLNAMKRTKASFKQLVVPGMLFEDMGLTYLGPVDGHDIKALTKTIKEAKKIEHAVLLHVVTKKGKGFEPAERHPARFHGTDAFDKATGIPLKSHKASYTDVFATVMNKTARVNEKLCAITAAMPEGTGLARFRNVYPDRFFDVGIAEAHAVTFAAGLAAGGMRVVVAIYSSFLQRAYDQIIHDVCIQNLPVVFAIDRAGLVGADGETHQGIFDLSYLRTMPNMHIMAPKNKWELADMLRYAVEFEGPIAIRYPRGEAYDQLKELREPIEYGKAEWLYHEKDIALFAVGSMVKCAVEVREQLKEAGYNVSIVNARFVKPIDEVAIMDAVEDHKLIVTLEENVATGGYGEAVTDFVNSSDLKVKVLNIALNDEYVEHGNVDILKAEAGIDAKSVKSRILAMLQKI